MEQKSMTFNHQIDCNLDLHAVGISTPTQYGSEVTKIQPSKVATIIFHYIQFDCN